MLKERVRRPFIRPLLVTLRIVLLPAYIAIRELLKVYYYLELLAEGCTRLFLLLGKVLLETSPSYIYKSFR